MLTIFRPSHLISWLVRARRVKTRRLELELRLPLLVPFPSHVLCADALRLHHVVDLPPPPRICWLVRARRARTRRVVTRRLELELELCLSLLVPVSSHVFGSNTLPLHHVVDLLLALAHQALDRQHAMT